MENGSLTSIQKNRLSRFAFLAKSQVTIQNHFLSTNLRLKYLKVIIIYVLILDTNLKSKNTLKTKLISAIKSSLILPRTCLLSIYPKVPKYGVIFGPYFLVFGLNTEKYRPEISPYLDTFHAVLY